MKNSGLPTTITRYFSNNTIESLRKLREIIHQYPELSLQEYNTQSVLKQALEQLEPHSIDTVAGTGLLATFKGTSSKAPITVIRGDMDALPIHEQTGVSFSSKHHGVMHACGHDVHATWAVGVGHLLRHHPVKGDVMILLQPAEEMSEGAKRVLSSQALNRADMIFGGHVDRRYAVPTVICQQGAVSAASDRFDIMISGQSSHGARPEEGCDPTPQLAEAIRQIHNLPSLHKETQSQCIISIGEIKAGTSHNIIPGTIQIAGTIRTQTVEAREWVHNQLMAKIESLNEEGISVAMTLSKGSPPIINSPQIIQKIKGNLGIDLPQQYIQHLNKPNMASEDFAYYLEKIPGCFLRIGARNKGESFIPVHSPQFIACEDAIILGAWALWRCCDGLDDGND